MITFITPIDFKVIDTTYGDKISPYAAKYTTTYGPEQEEAKAKMNAIMNEAKQELLRHREMSNEIQVIGNLCADPVQWENGRVTSYQLGVNRNFLSKMMIQLFTVIFLLSVQWVCRQIKILKH